MIRVILGVLLLGVLLSAAYYVYSPGSNTIAFQWYGFNGIAVEQRVAVLGEGFNQNVVEVTPDGRYVKVGHYGLIPGMSASPWLPDGTPIEYTYTRVTALFNATDVDPKRDVKWYVFDIHSKDIWEKRPASAVYGLGVVVKGDDRPVLDFNCLQLVKRNPKTDVVAVYNATCPGNTAIVYNIAVYYETTYTGKKELCVSAGYFRQDVWYMAGGWGFGNTVAYFCKSWEKPPRNITVTISQWAWNQNRVAIYVDGTYFDSVWVEGLHPRFYTGPYMLPYTPATARAFISLDYPGAVLKPLGSAYLLIGNDTVMMPPRYVLKSYTRLYGWGDTEARVELTYDRGVSVLPGRTYDNSTVYAWPVVPVKIHGRTTELPYRALVNAARLCPGGAVVSGRYSWVGGWVEVRGPTSIHCAEYTVEFLLPNGTSLTAPAPFNKTFVWTPPAIIYPNGTRMEADPVSVFIDGPKAVRVNYSRVFYLVRVVTPLGLNETWAPRGAAAGAPAVISLGNGTRWVAEGPASAAAEGPLMLAPRYKRQYLVRLEAPVNSTEVWVDEGLTFAVGLPDPWDLPNGTRFARLLVNGTARRDFRVDKPITLKAQYAEVYYWAVVETPVNKTAGWMLKGAVLKFPDIINFGNGTRLVGPSVGEVVVDKPITLKVEYAKRQHYVKIEGINRWEGWADAGSVIKLNATVVGGVEYTPAEVVTAAGPGVYRPLFYAVYKTAVRDALGVPNPLATVRLCNATASPLPDGSAVVAAYTRELCQPAVEAFPISPYTAAGAAAVATAAALVLKRRRK
jgi:hypothetical protein